MTLRHSAGRHSAYRDAAILLVIGLGLAVPFLPVPGDHMTDIAVRFRDAGMSVPHRFTGRTLESICRVLAATLSYDDRKGGDFTRFDCAVRPRGPRGPN
jgi:hypothetical protein